VETEEAWRPVYISRRRAARSSPPSRRPGRGAPLGGRIPERTRTRGNPFPSTASGNPTTCASHCCCPTTERRIPAPGRVPVFKDPPTSFPPQAAITTPPLLFVVLWTTTRTSPVRRPGCSRRSTRSGFWKRH
jgi:hypothetical protein